MFVNHACWHKQNFAYLHTKQQNSQTLVTTAIRERKKRFKCVVCLFHTIKHRKHKVVDQTQLSNISHISAEQLVEC